MSVSIADILIFQLSVLALYVYVKGTLQFVKEFKTHGTIMVSPPNFFTAISAIGTLVLVSGIVAAFTGIVMDPPEWLTHEWNLIPKP